jgi:hypothetical protein
MLLRFAGITNSQRIDSPRHSLFMRSSQVVDMFFLLPMPYIFPQLLIIRCCTYIAKSAKSQECDVLRGDDGVLLQTRAQYSCALIDSYISPPKRVPRTQTDPLSKLEHFRYLPM